jgi:phospholipase C
MKQIAALALLALTACGPSFAPSSISVTSSGDHRPYYDVNPKIRHVVIIIQENRSVDNLFNGFPGADTVRSGKNSLGKRVAMKSARLTAPFDISHEHSAFLIEHANGRLDGFNNVSSACRRGAKCPPADVRAYYYVPRTEIQPYWDMASQYTFADRTFQSNEGPSFPAHQYLLSGTSTIVDGSPLRAAGNAFSSPQGFTGGCDSPIGSIVWLIDELGNENQATYPCFERLSLTDLIARKSLTWRYYLGGHVGPGLWNAPDAIAHIRRSSSYATHVVAPATLVLSDIASAHLANVVWVTPTAAASDHPGTNDGTGPSWVASVVNALGKSSYWSDSAIFLLWDDWGGWYDHVPPPQYNSYELGFRVPLVVISPYAKRHYISHRQHEFGSILKFVEETFGVGSMHTTDDRSDDLSDCFDFGQKPTQFKPISAPRSAEYFLRQPLSLENPDDD